MRTKLATKPRVLMTTHQFEVLRAIITGNVTDDPTLRLLDLDELLDRVTRATSKQSMQFTIRALIHNGMIIKAGQVRRRGRSRVTYEATTLGRHLGEDKPATPAFLEDPGEAAVAAFLSAI